jgi:hypothetical protein
MRPAKRKRVDDDNSDNEVSVSSSSSSSGGDAPRPSNFLGMMMSLSHGWAATNANATREKRWIEERKKDAAAFAEKNPTVPVPTRFSVEDFRKEGEHVVWRFTDFSTPSPGFPIYEPDYRISFMRDTPADDPDTTIYGAVVHQATPRFCFRLEEKHGGLDRLLSCANGAVDIFAKPLGRDYDVIYGTRPNEERKRNRESMSSSSSSDGD